MPMNLHWQCHKSQNDNTAMCRSDSGFETYDSCNMMLVIIYPTPFPPVPPPPRPTRYHHTPSLLPPRPVTYLVIW